MLQTIKAIANRLELKTGDIFFLKNYKEEHNLEMEKNILILTVIKVSFANIDISSSSLKHSNSQTP